MTTLGNFPSATSIATTDYIPIEQGGLLKKASPSLLPFVPSGTGAVSESAQAMGRRIVWANQYGSQMATTPGADVNAAITALGSSGGIVYIAPGNYTIETSILQPSNVTIRGCGIGVTKLTAKLGLNSPVIKNATAFTSQVITITRTGRTATATKTAHGYSTGTWVFINGAVQIPYNGVFKIFNVTANTFDFYVEQTTTSPATGTIRVYQACETSLAVENLEIIGNSSNTTGSNYGIQFNGVENFRITDVYSHGCYHSQLALLSAANGTCTRFRGDETVSATSPGTVLGSGVDGAGGGIAYCGNLAFESCEAHKNAQTGFEAEFCRGLVINSFRGIGNVAAAGITISTASQVVISNAVCRLNTTGIELFLNGGATDVSVINAICQENGGAGIHLTNADATNTAKRVQLVGVNGSFNFQDSGASSAHGLNIVPAVGATIDGLVIGDCIFNNNGRGVSFADQGSVINVTMVNNRVQSNSSDFYIGTSLQLSTFQYGLNVASNGLNGISLRSVATSGIYLGNTANSDGTFLDWYQEGTFTPVLTFATPGNLNVVYAANGQLGYYTRHGDVVNGVIHINTSTFTHTTASGNLQITGFPFTSLNVTGLTQISGGGAFQGWTKANYTQIGPSLGSNSATIQFVASGSGQNVAFLGTGDMPSGGTIDFYITFTAKVQ